MLFFAIFVCLCRLFRFLFFLLSVFLSSYCFFFRSVSLSSFFVLHFFLLFTFYPQKSVGSGFEVVLRLLVCLCCLCPRLFLFFSFFFSFIHSFFLSFFHSFFRPFFRHFFLLSSFFFSSFLSFVHAIPSMMNTPRRGTGAPLPATCRPNSMAPAPTGYAAAAAAAAAACAGPAREATITG